MRNQKINLRWKLAAKDGIIQKYEEDLAYKKWDNNIKIKQEMYEYHLDNWSCSETETYYISNKQGRREGERRE